MAADALAPCITMSSAPLTLTVYDKLATMKGFICLRHLCWEIANIYS